MRDPDVKIEIYLYHKHTWDNVFHGILAIDDKLYTYSQHERLSGLLQGLMSVAMNVLEGLTEK